MTMNDKIFMEDIEIFATHGVHPGEKIRRQRFLVSVSATFDATGAKSSDEIAQTVNYEKLLEVVTAATQNSSFDLIERLAKHLADKIFFEFAMVGSLELVIKKFPHNLEHRCFSSIGFSSTFFRDEK
jgi:dihydroneopterin aldolase/2-amino-4-hydroxy-6-hydroxymethyldihydropteridine diphosphokinase